MLIVNELFSEMQHKLDDLMAAIKKTSNQIRQRLKGVMTQNHASLKSKL